MHSENVLFGLKDFQVLGTNCNFACPDAAAYQQDDATEEEELSSLHVMPFRHCIMGWCIVTINEFSP